MKITICIGSSCHLKGSRQIIEKLQQLINDNGLQDKVDLNPKTLKLSLKRKCWLNARIPEAEALRLQRLL